MTRFEEILRKSLRRDEAPPGFTERVLARVSARAGAGYWERLWTAFKPVPVRWAVVVALTLAFALGLRYGAGRQRRLEGEAAKADVLRALKITADKLEFAREKVMRLTLGGGSARRPPGPRI